MTIPKGGNPFARVRFDYASNGFSALTGLATLLIVAILFVILGNIAYFGWPSLSWRFVTGARKKTCSMWITRA